MNAEIQIRRLGSKDAGAVAGLERECFSEPWTADSLQEMIGNPCTLYLAAEWQGELVGYCGTQMVLDEGDILRVAVDKSHRGQGIGSRLLTELWRCTSGIHQWNLDVRVGNERAIRLYEKHGFLPIGIRKNYYHKPLENAILMQRKS